MRKSALRIAVLVLIVAMTMGTLGFAVAQEGDTLNILYWQAVSTLNPYLSGGTKDIEGGSLVLEPLARYNELGEMVPWLVDEIPTVENGGVSEDLMSITWTLSEGLVWSDGTPVTSADVVFTWQYCTHPDAGCNALSKFTDVTNVEAVDDRTVVITFGVPKPFPYGPFVGAQSPIIQAAQFADCVGANAQNCTDQNFYPIGTGPYVVTNFLANDVVEFAANPNYREEGKPYFQRIVFKGGGDAESAARAVLETGEFDYAWNLQVVPQILDQMVAAGQGQLVVSFGTSVERIHINHTNPDSALGDMRSVWVPDGSNGHPFLQVPEIWKAMSMAIDRDLIASQLYGAAGKATCNLLPAPAAYASPNNEACLVQDIAGANALLDGAGIVDSDGDGVREYNGIPLRVLYQTSTNAVRQATQALIKDWWAQIGIEAELRNIDAAVFFGNDLASPDTYGKFYADVEMFTNNYDGTDPEAYMAQWTCAEIAGPDNDYLGNNISRWCNPDYDALVAQMAQTGSLQERAALAIAMNDMIVQDGAMIGLVHRGDVSAISNSLEGVLMNSWDSELWNVADWTRSN
ncbi:MAG: peptide ABC transporter substrate-binding protein [Chloroflexi bacterium]|nr:MAG: putative peptide ABC transporter substrate binding protein [Chloroflexi bacterium OLB13]MBW7877980.1 peptide ABC transporter substrate-binding protein [Anaerolineae bacterium]MCC6566577.1 peptide ABC transporter substrate-binding protein [Chloroflexota bacterium]